MCACLCKYNKEMPEKLILGVMNLELKTKEKREMAQVYEQKILLMDIMAQEIKWKSLELQNRRTN